MGLRGLVRSDLLGACGLGLGSGELEIVVDAEDSGSSVGLHIGDVCVGLPIDVSEEVDVAVFHDDMNGVEANGRTVRDASGHECDVWLGTGSAADTALIRVIPAERRKGVDAVVDGGADAVVHGRVGKNLDVVLDAGYALDTLNYPFGIAFEDWARGITAKNDVLAVNAKGEPVEYAVVGEAEEALADFFGDAEGVFVGECWAGLGVLSAVLSDGGL